MNSIDYHFDGIKCVTLDLDDTLWPVEPTLIRAEHAVYDWMQQNFPAITDKYTANQLLDKRVALGQQREDIAHNVTELRYCALQELAEEFNYDSAFAESALALFRHHRNQVQPYPHSESVLSYLQQGYILGAITNGNAQLDNISLGQFFDFVVTAEQVGVSKPHHRIFVHAARQAGVDVDEMVHIGDSPQTDVLGALKAGYKAIWFNQKRLVWPGGQTPDKVVHCLSELPQVLKYNHKT